MEAKGQRTTSKDAISSVDHDVLLSLSSVLASNNVAQDFLVEVAQWLIGNLPVNYAIIGSLDEANQEMATLCVVINGEVQENFTYHMEGTPCAGVIGAGNCLHPAGVKALFPHDEMLQSMNVEGYVGQPLIDAAGRTIGIVVTLSEQPLQETEITLSALKFIAGRTSAELTRMRYEKALVQASEAKSNFLTIMSHELRTPMHGVMGFADVLEATDLTEQQQEYLTLLRSSAKNLLSVLNDILDLSAIEKGETKIERHEFSLLEFIEEFKTFWEIQARSRALKFSVERASLLPTIIKSDPERLRRVLSNLMSNALKFTEHGGITVSITADEQVVRFEVKDTGIGIAEKDFTYLFEKFHQIEDSLTRRFGGTGLGLTISKSLITLLGGEIGVESKLDEGSTFWITIPNTTGLLQKLEPPKVQQAQKDMSESLKKS